MAEIQIPAIPAGSAFIFPMHLAGVCGNILTAEADGDLAREDEPPAAGVQTNAHGKEGKQQVLPSPSLKYREHHTEKLKEKSTKIIREVLSLAR